MKVTKRVFALLFAVAILLSVAVIPAFADTTDQPRVVDQSDLFTDEEEALLTAKLKDYSEQQNCDIVFLTVDDYNHADFSFNGTTQDYADIYYETHGYAKDGVLVMLAQNSEIVGDRKICFSTSGKAIKRLNDDEWNEIIDDITGIIPPRSAGKDADFYPTFDKIADEINEKMTPHLKWYMLPLAIIIGFVIAMVIMFAIRSKLKTVAMQRGAVNYIRQGSMNVTASRDTYLYSTVSKTKREKSSSSHTSSSGGSHGGGSRSI